MAIYDSPKFILGVRALQGFLTIITLGLTAYVADWWSGYWHASAPSQVNFLLFCSVWAIIALIYLIVVPWKFSHTQAHHKFAILGFEGITMFFWFAGFIALAVFLGDRVCFGNVCSAAKAAAAFGAFEWIAWTITTVLAALHAFGRGGAGSSRHADPKLNMAEGV
ncbi:hypothetical protein LTR95_015062 [Oleoguttula sp. CCFEE 5521]